MPDFVPVSENKLNFYLNNIRHDEDLYRMTKEIIERRKWDRDITEMMKTSNTAYTKSK